MRMIYVAMKAVYTVPVMAFLIFAYAFTQKNLSQKMQYDLDREVSENTIGILVSVSSPDQDFAWTGASGLSDREKKTKLQPKHMFRIASVTKTFVAATILRLWEDGKLGLDDPITDYISEEHAGILKKGGYEVEQIRIKHLLRHSSGLAEHVNSFKFEVDFMKEKHIWTRSEPIQDLITYAQPKGQVGENFSYSDTGYILLGEIIEKLTQKTMGEAILEELNLKELGINNTYMEDFNGDFSGRRIHQYHENVDTYHFHPSMDYYGGGGLLSTTDDLTLFFQCLFQHKIFRNKSTLDQMLSQVQYKSEPSLDYRMGIWKIEIDGKTAYTHSGFWGTQVVYIPESQTAIACNYSQRWNNSPIAPVIPKLLRILEQWQGES